MGRGETGMWSRRWSRKQTVFPEHSLAKSSTKKASSGTHEQNLQHLQQVSWCETSPLFPLHQKKITALTESTHQPLPAKQYNERSPLWSEGGHET